MLSESQIQEEQIVTVSPEESLHALACKIAVKLGAGWSYKLPRVQEGDRLPRWAEVVHAAGYALSVSTEWNQPERVKVSGNWPRDGRGQSARPYTPHGEKEPTNEITVAAVRGVEAIAKEIERRLLPVFVPRWTKAAEQVHEADESEKQRRALLARLAKIAGATEKDYRQDRNLYLYVGGHSIEVEVNGADSARIKASLPTEGAARVLAVAIEEAKKSEGAD